jgi:hypothetical protein
MTGARTAPSKLNVAHIFTGKNKIIKIEEKQIKGVVLILILIILKKIQSGD